MISVISVISVVNYATTPQKRAKYGSSQKKVREKIEYKGNFSLFELLYIVSLSNFL